jgi:hypothetical protein
MVDLGYEHIFLAILTSSNQFNFSPFLFIITFISNWFYFILINVNISIVITQVFHKAGGHRCLFRWPRTDDPPDLAPEPMTNDFDIFHENVKSYFQLLSQMTIDPSVNTFGTQYEASCASSYDTPGLSTWVSDIQAPAP